MSEQEHSPLADCPEYRQLTELHTKQATLSTGLAADDFAAPGIESAYRSALQEVTEQSAELAANPELQERIASAGSKAVRVLEQLGPLHGILSEEEILKMESNARQDAASVADYYRRYGANTEEAREILASLANVGNLAVAGAMVSSRPTSTPPAPAAPSVPPTPSPEREPSVKEITLVLEDEGVKVGKRAKLTPYAPNARQEIRAKLIHGRRSMLAHMAKNPGKMFSSPELWAAAFGQEAKYDKDSMNLTRKWLLSLTHRRETLVVSTGAKTSYRIGISPSFITHVDDRHDKSVDHPDAKPEDRELGGVRLGSLYVVAQRLVSNNHVLEAHGLAVFDEKLKEALEEYKPDMSDLITDADRLAYRNMCVSEVQDIFRNDGRFLALLESLDEDEALRGVVGYLMDLWDKPDDRRFISRLMGARPRTKAALAPRGGNVSNLQTELVDQGGNVLWPVETAETSDEAQPSGAPAAEEETETPAAAASPNLGTEPKEEPADPTPPSGQASPVPERKGTIRRLVNGEEVWVDDERNNDEKRAKLQELEDYAYELSCKFLASFDKDKCYSRPQLQNVFTDFTARMSVDARENKVGPKERQNPMYALDDLLRVMIYSHSQFQHISAHKRKSTQDLVKRIVNQGIQRAEADTKSASTAA